MQYVAAVSAYVYDVVVGRGVGAGTGLAVGSPGSGVSASTAHVTEMPEFVCHSDPSYSLHVPDTAVRSSSGSLMYIAALFVQASEPISHKLDQNQMYISSL